MLTDTTRNDDNVITYVSRHLLALSRGTWRVLPSKYKENQKSSKRTLEISLMWDAFLTFEFLTSALEFLWVGITQSSGLICHFSEWLLICSTMTIYIQLGSYVANWNSETECLFVYHYQFITSAVCMKRRPTDVRMVGAGTPWPWMLTPV